jgi:GAF domain-containing protein
MLGLDPALSPPDYPEHGRLFIPESWARLSAALSRTRETGAPYELELETVRRDGTHGWMLARGEALRDENRAIIAIHGVVADITERKQAEAALARHARDLGERVKEMACLRDITTLLLDKGAGVEQILDACARRIPAAFFDPAHTCARIRLGEQIFLSAGFHETGRKLEAAMSETGLASGLIEVFHFGETAGESPFLDEERGLIRSIATQIAQLLGRRQAEAAIVHANRALAALGAVNRSLVRATDETALLQSICAAIVEQRGYRMAWVGYAQHDENKTVRIMASAGYDEGYLDSINVTWAENERGMGPTGRAIRSGTTQLCQDFAHDPRHLPWRDAALERGYAASIALPLANGEVFGALTVYASEVNAFTPAEVALLEEMAGDMAFGVRALSIRQERDRALKESREYLEKLQGSLEGTVSAIARIVEMRDPYTAGHQARVAKLAAAIARQMGLSEERVHGIHLAGTIHDLGKIQVPAEILSKPGRLSEVEYSLIKVHPEAGYDILKNIDFPWPIADKVLQHHERFDGSGYPQGLKGEEISLGARIISVADTVEAMSSHRPYRPGLGVEAALAEITQQRGILYDPQVVDACLALFREQKYRLE